VADLQLFLARISSSILPGIDPAIQGVRRDKFDGFHLLKGRNYRFALSCNHMGDPTMIEQSLRLGDEGHARQGQVLPGGFQ